MRAKSVLLLLLALGCGLVASIGITQVMATRDSAAPPGVDTESIFVAMKDVAMGDPLTAQMVKLEPWPKDRIPPGAIAKLEDLEGRKPRAPIVAGAPILDKQLLGKGATEQGPSGIIPAGFRVAPVKVESGIGNTNMIRPSDRVDVLVYVKQDAAKGITQTLTRTILQDIKVFAVNDQYDLAASAGEKSIAAKTIWLLVAPEQAEKLMLGCELGQIRLVMRSPGDKEQRKLDPVNPRELLGDSFGDDSGSPRMEKEDRAQAGIDKALAMLSNLSKQKQPSDAPPPVPALAPRGNGSWTIRILAGTRVTDALLENEPAEAGAIDRWKVASTSEWSTPAPAPAPAPAPTAKPVAAPPKRERQGKATDDASVVGDRDEPDATKPVGRK